MTIPGTRITPERVQDYVADLRIINAPYTVLAGVQELYQAMRAPERKLGLAPPHRGACAARCRAGSR
jgi:hypothetical protein